MYIGGFHGKRILTNSRKNRENLVESHTWRRETHFWWCFDGKIRSKIENHALFPFFAVLEATDAESLLDQFEEAATTSDVEATEESPKRTSNIYKAVKNHFAASGQANPKRNPRIGKNISLYNTNNF